MIMDNVVLSRRDRFLALLDIYDLSLTPVAELGPRARLERDPGVMQVKAQLEDEWLTELELRWSRIPAETDATTVEGVVSWLRGIAVDDRLPQAYQWLSSDASLPDLVRFLAWEGGPDGGFDDLVALCQVGLDGRAKLELGKNYWDEMGNGDIDGVHTNLHRRLTAALELPAVSREHLPIEALERSALNGLLATNRWLQPEMVGALGLTELQAGPRCRLVLNAFDRLGVPEGAYPFYREHAEVDPVHGKDWVEKVVVPLVEEHPQWGPRIIKGALWRARTNLDFFAAAHELIAVDLPALVA